MTEDGQFSTLDDGASDGSGPEYAGAACLQFESEFMVKFDPVKVLGEGSFGCVFEARNIVDHWKYAVKRIPLCGSDRAIEKALIEVRALASLRHEGIVGYHHSWIEKPPEGWQRRFDNIIQQQIGYDGSLPHSDCSKFMYIQLELCQRTLHQWLAKTVDRDWNVHEKAWFKQLATALAYLHRKEKIHRDLKPCNILIAEDDRLKIADLGLVSNIVMLNNEEYDKTRTEGAGTKMYMAPEQRGRKYTSKVDIYALGLILAELCVYMTHEETKQAFEKYKSGQTNPILRNAFPAAEAFVVRLTSYERSLRPNCEEILNDAFLA